MCVEKKIVDNMAIGSESIQLVYSGSFSSPYGCGRAHGLVAHPRYVSSLDGEERSDLAAYHIVAEDAASTPSSPGPS